MQEHLTARHVLKHHVEPQLVLEVAGPASGRARERPHVNVASRGPMRARLEPGDSHIYNEGMDDHGQQGDLRPDVLELRVVPDARSKTGATALDSSRSGAARVGSAAPASTG